MTDETSSADAAATDWETLDHRAIRAHFGEAFAAVDAYAGFLAAEGELRGLLGPRELERLWERHILNSAAVVPFLGEGSIVDVGSGAGLPGLVIAAMVGDRPVTLVEPMERRVRWLEEATDRAGLTNVTIVRGRAEEVRGDVRADVVTARAVAPIEKLVKWCAPLLTDTGRMALLKGRSAPDEIERAKHVLRKAGLVAVAESAPTIDGLEPTTVVTVRRAA